MDKGLIFRPAVSVSVGNLVEMLINSRLQESETWSGTQMTQKSLPGASDTS